MSSKPFIKESLEQYNSIRSLLDEDARTVKSEAEETSEQWNEQPWSLISSYFRGKYLEKLVRHQLESYNDFIGFQIQKTISMFSPIRIESEQDYDPDSKKYKLTVDIAFDNFNIYRPVIHENNGATKLMFPQEARSRNFTYASNMTINMNIKYTVRSGENLENTQTYCKTLPKIQIGKIPIMLKSSICLLSQYKHIDYKETGECKVDPGGYFIINGSEKTVLGQERAAENRVYCFNVMKGNNKWSYMAELNQFQTLNVFRQSRLMQ